MKRPRSITHEPLAGSGEPETRQAQPPWPAAETVVFWRSASTLGTHSPTRQLLPSGHSICPRAQVSISQPPVQESHR